jgi:hypothetical protein
MEMMARGVLKNTSCSTLTDYQIGSILKLGKIKQYFAEHYFLNKVFIIIFFFGITEFYVLCTCVNELVAFENSRIEYIFKYKN